MENLEVSFSGPPAVLGWKHNFQNCKSKNKQTIFVLKCNRTKRNVRKRAVKIIPEALWLPSLHLNIPHPSLMSRLKQTPADWSDPDISWHGCKFQRRCKHVIKFSHPQVGLNANSSPSGRGELGLSHLDSEDWKQQQEEEEVWHLPLMSRQEGWWFSLVWFVGASCWLRPVLWLWLWSVGLGSRSEWGVPP